MHVPEVLASDDRLKNPQVRLRAVPFMTSLLASAPFVRFQERWYTSLDNTSHRRQVMAMPPETH